MSSNKTLKIVPNAELLLKNPLLKCSVDGCNSIFKTSSNLNLHLEKHHRIELLKFTDPSAEVQYHCPVDDCKYNVANGILAKCFKSKKYLRQHYMKVHAVKTAKCSNCDKSFVSVQLLEQHVKLLCGKSFECGDCDCSYSTRECLLTHCRRKGHSAKHVHEQNASGKNGKTVRKTSLQVEVKPVAVSSQLLLRKIQIKVDQNEPRTASKQTQTTPFRRSNRPKTANKSTAIRPKSKAVGTSTKVSQRKKCVDLHSLDDECGTMIDNQSQTCSRSLNNLNYVEDDSSLHYFTVANFNAGLCHIETQTELIESCDDGERDMDPLLCHMHTQTSDEILSEFGLSNIQTQTRWPDDTSASAYNNELFVSTETQTCFHSPQLIIDNISIHTQTVSPDQQWHTISKYEK